jgi:hypothetical protein
MGGGCHQSDFGCGQSVNPTGQRVNGADEVNREIRQARERKFKYAGNPNGI